MAPLSQAAAARVLKINQPKVAALKNYELDGFSVERLITFLLSFGQDVEIRIRSHGKSEPAPRIHVETRGAIATCRRWTYEMPTLFDKLNSKTQEEILVLNSPDSFEKQLESLKDVRVSRK